MRFSKMIKLLQNKDKGYIILVATGNFYIARGKIEEKLNCYICQNTVKKYKKHDKNT